LKKIRNKLKNKLNKFRNNFWIYGTEQENPLFFFWPRIDHFTKKNVRCLYVLEVQNKLIYSEFFISERERGRELQREISNNLNLVIEIDIFLEV